MMNTDKLVEKVVNQILVEENIARKKVVVYSGRFQPFHKGHFEVYKHLTEKFGSDNVYIGTSNKVSKPRSPFSFKEKLDIMTSMFRIPKNKIVQIKNPYAPKEILKNFDEDTTAYITVVGNKDKNRLGGSYFEDYRENKSLESFRERGYIYVAPSLSDLSGTDVRSKLGEPSSSEDVKRVDFKRMYGKFDEKIFNLVVNKLTESVILEWFYEDDLMLEMPKSDVKKIDQYADSQLEPIDIDLSSNHFFQRLNDPRNKKEISQAELIGFFKRLKKDKKQFIDFLNKYKQIVATDKRTNINIPFMKKANKAIAKTVMRKNDFKTSNVKLVFESDNIDESQFSIKPGFKFIAKKSMKYLKKGTEYVVNDIKGKVGNLTVLVNKPGDNTIIPINVRSEAEFYKKVMMNESKGVRSSITLNELIKDIKNSADPVDNRILLQCGGTYGHMNHPFDLEIDLTFGDLKKIVEMALEGELKLTREKTDGYALSISWRDDRGLIAARNKSHLKNFGKTAMDINGVKDKFGGRGELTNAYTYAMKDLEKAISSLSSSQRDKIFKNGKCFMQLEVIFPQSINVIPYGQSLLVFHNTIEYDEDGNPVGENQEAARILAGMIKQVNADVQEYYNIQGPPIQEIPKSEDLSKKKPKYKKQIDQLQKEFNLSNNDGVSEYHKAWWEDWVEKNAPKSLDNKTKMQMVRRWAFFDRSNRLNGKTIPDDEVLQWAKEVDKQRHSDIAKKNLRKFERIFLALGAEILSFMSSVLTVNPDKASQQMKDRLDKTIKDIKNSANEQDIQKLKKELERLEQAGGVDKIVPNEGIVFEYKGKTLKLTGTFASLNQILGIMYK